MFQIVIHFLLVDLPSITVPPSSTSVALATSGTFNCTATGNPEPQYHWLYNGQEIPGAEVRRDYSFVHK